MDFSGTTNSYTQNKQFNGSNKAIFSANRQKNVRFKNSRSHGVRGTCTQAWPMTPMGSQFPTRVHKMLLKPEKYSLFSSLKTIF